MVVIKVICAAVEEITDGRRVVDVAGLGEAVKNI